MLVAFRDHAQTRRWRGRLSAALVATVVAACTSSDGGGGVGPGSGQGPDPIVLDFPIAYVKRPVPSGAALAVDARQLLDFEPGGDLYVRDRASPSAAERNVTEPVTQGKGDVRDVEPSFDGTKLAFALHRPLLDGAAPDEQPTWEIWEYVVATRELRRVVASDIVARQGNDVAPAYLPDGRIVFSSTRQRQSKAILLDEGKPQFEAQDEDRREPAFVLHVMTTDGGDVHQVSFNQSHDLDPAVLDDGRIVFSRWDGAPGHNELSIYAMRPDGTQLELLYGANSHQTGTDGSDIQFLDPRPMGNGHLLVRAQPMVAPERGGELLDVEVSNYVENTQPMAANIGVLSGPAQKPATVNIVRTVAGPSPGGRYQSAFPLRDGTGRLLVSWTQCRLLEGTAIVPCTADRLAAAGATPAPPLRCRWTRWSTSSPRPRRRSRPRPAAAPPPVVRHPRSRWRSTSRSATPSPWSMAPSPPSTPPSRRSTSRPRRSPASSRSSVARLLSSWRSTRSSRTSSTAPPHHLAAPHHHPGAPLPG